MASLGILKSGTPNTGTSIHGFKIQTTFTQESISPGKTKVSWTFKTIYEKNSSYPASSSKAYSWIKLIFTAKDGCSISEITGEEYESGNTVNSYPSYTTSTTLGSGSMTVTHTSQGKASFDVKADVSVAGYGCDASASYTLTDNMPYTKCSAPTSVTASGIIGPNGTFTVTWSGAKPGHANAISGYRVYYSLTSTGTAPTTSTTTYKDVSSSVSSTTFTVSNATRKYKIVCGVVTLGTAGFNSEIKTGGSVTINSLPGAPTASVNKTVVPSTNGQVTFTVTAGTDSDSSQTKTLYYSTSSSSSSTKTKITSPWSPTVTATTTYYFWTYDGLEYSSTCSTGIKITKNTKPTFNLELTGQNLSSINNSSGYNYTISPTIKITDIANGQSNKKYIYTLNYGANNSVASSKVLYNLDTATQKTISDIRKESIGHESNGAYYRFSVQCYDGVEYSEVKTTDIRYVTKTPSLIGLYNKPSFLNVDGFYSGDKATHYSKYLGFIFQQDAGYNLLKFNNHNGIVQSINLTTGDTNENTRGSWTTTEEVASSINHNLSYQIGYSGGYSASAVTQNITKIAKVSLSNFNFSLSGQSYKFFTDSNEYNNTVGHSYSSSPLTSGSIKNYGINSNLSFNNFFARIYTNNVWSNAINISPNTSGTNDNTISFNLNASSIANVISSLFTTAQKNNSYNSTIRLSIINDFEDESYIDSNFIIDFKENDEYLKITSIDIHPSSNNNKLDQWQYLKEGMGDLIGNFTITSYNTNPKGEVQIYRDTEKIWTTLNTFNFSGSGAAAPNAPITYTVSNLVVQTIREISNSTYNVSYRLIVTTDAGSKTFPLYNNIPVRGHVPAILTIQNSSYDGTNLEIGYNIASFGADITNLRLGNNKTISLYLDGESIAKSIYIDNSSNYFSSSSKIAIFVYDFSNSESNLVKLGISTILGTYLKTDTAKNTPYFETTKTSNLNSIDAVAIFNILPTVAYRKNHLGINILDPSDNSNAIIVIGEASGRDTIYFKPADNNYCKVVNFLLDGGTW